MADIVNLRQARKHKQRAAKAAAADQNRVLHGRPKAEKLRDREAAERAAAFLDSHRRDPSGKRK
jgi:Domain of unknown function (DUF4169)